MPATVEQWVRETLRVVDITAPRRRPWASVARVSTPDRVWWLKVSSAGTAHEPRLTEMLRRHSSLVPEVVVHPDRPWMLVADAGRSARERLGEDAEDVVAYWCAVLPAYGELQRRVPVAEARAAGTPDYSPLVLGKRLQELLDDVRWFAPELSGRPWMDTRRRGIEISTGLATLADELAATRPPAVQHDDLHDGNVFGAARVAGLSRAAGWARALGSPEAGAELGYGGAVDHWVGRLGEDVRSAGAAG